MVVPNSLLVQRTGIVIGVAYGSPVRKVESHIRFRIDELFRAARITIAFTQRDVHLDVQPPLEVRMVGAGDEARRP